MVCVYMYSLYNLRCWLYQAPHYQWCVYVLLFQGGQSKYVKQFHFTTWPDHGVPRFGHSLLLFRQKIRAYDNLDNGAVVVHCR